MTVDTLETFRDLHSSGCFVMPNAWDPGSAKALAGLGFAAVATTSSGFAFTRGLADGAVPLEDMLEHIAEVVGAVDVPVNADFLNGFADDADDVAANVRACLDTGIAGLSIEDMRADRTLYDVDHAVERVRAARAAIDASGRSVLLTARSEAFLVGHEDPLNEATTRLRAFVEAGADVLFAPGASTPEDIRAIVDAVAPRPINVIAGPASGSVDAVAALGVRRISLASGLARAAWGGFLRAARALADGSFEGLREAPPSGDVVGLFGEAGTR